MTIPVAFLAPGAGLGHLVRASALALALRDLEVDSCIVTSSPLAQAMARLSDLRILGVPMRTWGRPIAGMLADLAPGLVVQDTFPAGFRGEWLDDAMRSKWRRCYLARYLKVGAYAEALECTVEAILPTIPEHTILLEELNVPHRSLLNKASTQLHSLTGPAHYPPSHAPAIPSRLDAMLNRGRLRLIVHSGPTQELEQLVSRARVDMVQDDELALVAPIPSYPDIPTFDYFPASTLYDRALHIYTGAGYNSMAERAPIPQKHTAIAFPRHYDDQSARTQMTIPPHNGASAAAQILAGLC